VSFTVQIGALCAVLFLVALFFLLYAMSSFYYPPSRTTGEAYPVGAPVPRRWAAIGVQAAISVIAAAAGVGLFALVLKPEISAKARAEQVGEAESITHSTFKSKLGQFPKEVSFPGEDPRNGLQQFLKSGWELKGTATLDDGSLWDVTVAKSGIELKCDAKRRE
jgi:hypothetical protein